MTLNQPAGPREAAGEVFRSPNSVEAHLSRIYRPAGEGEVGERG